MDTSAPEQRNAHILEDGQPAVLLTTRRNLEAGAVPRNNTAPVVCIDELLATLTADNLALAVEIARIPEDIRGYGHVKERHLRAVRPQWSRLMAQWRSGKASAAQRQAA